ncbi:MAG: hypothetical protein ACQERC_10740 [Bacteroidota bacterium]
MKSVFLTIVALILSLARYTQREIIVKFNYEFLNEQFIDDKSSLTAQLNALFNDKAEREQVIVDNVCNAS